MNTELIEKFAPVLIASSAPIVRDPRLLMDAEDDVAVYYSPFEYINPKAQVVLVGITPGPTQMVNANNVARRELLTGSTPLNAIRTAKQEGAFSGKTMRANLIRQLDHWGIQTWLGMKSTKELFEGAQELVQTTSLLRYPVFVGSDDYRGTPDMTRNALLRKYLFEHLCKRYRTCQRRSSFRLDRKCKR